MERTCLPWPRGADLERHIANHCPDDAAAGTLLAANRPAAS
jgi:hypothetical protein